MTQAWRMRAVTSAERAARPNRSGRQTDQPPSLLARKPTLSPSLNSIELQHAWCNSHELSENRLIISRHSGATWR